ncbi:hypothetical protein EDM54_24345 [Brevibacillus borstelensis]|uniref:hypothetical protein n=1 Tax=Brevibacillus borstelensis TaxID=45462 RepID=UPI000F0747FE|nr:hypothetical protein [Brevibacillus borstelensis]MED1882011.1 hypothetical protein [Brevibacillus borstelensis]RNB56123.1 hypothetical protein EDM54_24345 [Brevibacillus borstelensis]
MSGILGLIFVFAGIITILVLIFQGIKEVFSNKSVEPINGSVFKGWLAETISGCLVFLIFFAISIGLIWGGLFLMSWGAE